MLHVHGHDWRIMGVSQGSLQLDTTRRSDDGAKRILGRQADLDNEIAKRREDVVALGRQRDTLTAQMDGDEDMASDALLQEFAQIMALRARHLRSLRKLSDPRIARQVTATTTITTTRVVLPAGQRVVAEPMGPGTLLWSPLSSTGTAVCTTKTRTTTETLTLPTPFVQGAFHCTWGALGQGNGHFQAPTSVAVTAEEVFVCDYENSRLQVFGRQDQMFRRAWGEYGESPGQLQSPVAVVVTPQVPQVPQVPQEVLVCDDGNSQIHVFGLDGSFRRAWGGYGVDDGQFRNPTAVAVAAHAVFVCDSSNDRIQVFGLDGTFRRQWGCPDPQGVAIAGTEVFVCNGLHHRVMVFGLDGVFRRQWGSEGEGVGQFQCPRGIAVRGQQSPEVIVSDALNHRLQVFGLDGSFRRTWGKEGEGDGQFQYPTGVCVTGDQVFVSDTRNHRLQIFV